MSKSYRWLIAVACSVVSAVTMGIVNNCFSIYTIPVTQGLHVSREVFSVGQTVMFFTTMLMNLATGMIVEKTGIARAMRISAIILGISYFSCSLVQNIGQFIALSAVVGLMMPFVTNVPISLLIHKWFRGSNNAGLALGIAMMGSGIGGMIFNPFGTYLITRFGWRYTYGILGVMMFATVVCIAVFLIREPDETRENAGKSDAGADGQRSVHTGENADITGNSLYEDFRSPVFWIVIAVSFFIGAACYSTLNFTSTYLQDVGHTPAYAAGVASVSMAAMAAGKILIGRIYDRAGTVRATAVGTAALIIGMLGFSFIRTPGALGAVLFGALLGSPMGSVAVPIIVRHVLGDRDYAKKMSIAVSSCSFGSGLTPVFSGHLYETAGSYAPMYRMLAVALLLTFTVYRIIFYRKRV